MKNSGPRAKTPPRVAPRLEGKVKNVGIKPERKPKKKREKEARVAIRREDIEANEKAES